MLIEEQRNTKPEKQLENYFLGDCLPNTLTGFKRPDLMKFMEMVVFFAERLQPWKTKLNKLLFYADFAMYKQSGFSISGVKYKAILLGPVPYNYDSLFEYFANKGGIDICYTGFSDGGTGEQFKPHPARIFNRELFSEPEIKVVESVAERFKNTTAAEIIEISHQEKAWIENQAERKIIDYLYSFDLNQPI